MVSILGFIQNKLQDAEIPYEYGEWTAAVTYPYFVGSFDETEYRFEDSYTAGIFTLDGWARGSGAKLALMTAADTVKQLFTDLRAVENGRAFFIEYGGAISAPSGEEDLYHVTITLYTHEWEGE